MILINSLFVLGEYIDWMYSPKWMYLYIIYKHYTTLLEFNWVEDEKRTTDRHNVGVFCTHSSQNFYTRCVTEIIHAGRNQTDAGKAVRLSAPSLLDPLFTSRIPASLGGPWTRRPHPTTPANEAALHSNYLRSFSPSSSARLRRQELLRGSTESVVQAVIGERAPFPLSAAVLTGLHVKFCWGRITVLLLQKYFEHQKKKNNETICCWMSCPHMLMPDGCLCILIMFSDSLLFPMIRQEITPQKWSIKEQETERLDTHT